MPKWLATLGVGVAIGAAALMMLQELNKTKPAEQDGRPTAAALPKAALEIDDSAGGVPIALITGASPGTMGGCTAEALAALGCHIAAVEHPLRRAQCEELCKQLEAECVLTPKLPVVLRAFCHSSVTQGLLAWSRYGVRAVALTADATDAAQVEASFAAAVAQLGGEPNVVVSTVGGGGVATDGSTRNGGTDLDGRPRTELAHEESWDTTQVASELLLL